MNLDASSVRSRAGERPLGHASIALNEVPRVAPMRVREGLKYLHISGPNRISAGVARTTYIGACRGFEYAIVRHESHQGIDIMTIPGVGKRLQVIHGDASNYGCHVSSP